MPRPPAPPRQRFNWRRGVRLLVWAALLAGLAWGGKRVNSFLLRDPRFALACPGSPATCAALEIHGAVYASRWRIQSVFAQDFGASVFHVPLDERRRRLLAVDWVNSASLERVWPSRIVVDVT